MLNIYYTLYIVISLCIHLFLDCSASALPPIYTCDSDVITAGWLTDNLYPTNMKETPAIITQEVLPKFNDFQPMGYIGLSLSSQTM